MSRSRLARSIAALLAATILSVSTACSSDAVQQTLVKFVGVQTGLLDSFVEERGTIHARVTLSQSVLENLLPVLDLLQGGG